MASLSWLTEQAINQGAQQSEPALTLAPTAPRLHASDTLEDGVVALGATDDEAISVLDDEDQLIGWLTHRRSLRAYRTQTSNGHVPQGPNGGLRPDTQYAS